MGTFTYYDNMWEHKYSRAMEPLNVGLVGAKIEFQVYKYDHRSA